MKPINSQRTVKLLSDQLSLLKRPLSCLLSMSNKMNHYKLHIQFEDSIEIINLICSRLHPHKAVRVIDHQCRADLLRPLIGSSSSNLNLKESTKLLILLDGRGGMHHTSLVIHL